MRKLLLLLLLLILASGGGALYLAKPIAPMGSRFVEIDHGMSTRAIAQTLTEQGVIRSPWAFMAVRVLHRRSRLQAGEYEFSGESNVFEVFDKIRSGRVFFQLVTFPEGSNMFDIAGVVDTTGIIRAADFVAAASDPLLIKDLDPKAPSLEGYLFPSSYRITHSTTARELCRAMTAEFRKQWSALAKGAVDIHQTVTLASLVEREAAIPTERPLVASVFDNRLRIGMPLQCDPTTVYAALLEKRFHGVIHKSDLASTNAYNTYTHLGLPPGPIANPGIASLNAALRPAHSNALYFVAKADGTSSHRFSATLAEHQQAVAIYRKAVRDGH